MRPAPLIYAWGCLPDVCKAACSQCLGSLLKSDAHVLLRGNAHVLLSGSNHEEEGDGVVPLSIESAAVGSQPYEPSAPSSGSGSGLGSGAEDVARQGERQSRGVPPAGRSSNSGSGSGSGSEEEVEVEEDLCEDGTAASVGSSPTEPDVDLDLDPDPDVCPEEYLLHLNCPEWTRCADPGQRAHLVLHSLTAIKGHLARVNPSP